LTLAVTAFLLGLATAAAPLYVSSVGSAAVAVQVGQQCRTALGDAAVGSGRVQQVDAATRSLNRVSQSDLSRAGAADGGLDRSVVTLDSGIAVRPVGGRPRIEAQLVSRTGALSHIEILASKPGPGVFVSDDVASLLRIRPGNMIRLAIDDPAADASAAGRQTLVRVRGVYRGLVGTVLPSYWCSQTSIFGVPDSPFPPPPVVLADQPTFRSTFSSLGQSTVSYFDWERPVNPDVTLGEARTVASGETDFHTTIDTGSSGSVDRGSPGRTVPGWTAARGFEVSDPVPLQYPFVTRHALAVQKVVGGAITPTALASALIAILLMAAAGLYWVEKRRLELQLLLSRGVGVGAIGVKACLEGLVPIVLGIACGCFGAIGLVKTLGPSSELDATYLRLAVFLSLGGTAVAVTSMGLVAAVRLRRTVSRSRPAGGLRNWPRAAFELVLLGLTLLAWRDLGHPTLVAGSTTAAPTTTAFLVFPLLFLVCSISLATHLLFLLFRSRWPRTATRASPFPVWLSVRRVSASPAIASVVVASVAVTSGVYFFAAIVKQSQQQTLHAKAETFVGGDVSADVGRIQRLPRALSAVATEVLADSYGPTVGSTSVDVLGVDPATFGRGAFWDASYSSSSSSSSLGDLLSRLGTPARRHGAPLPVIVVGDTRLSLRRGLLLPGASRPSPVTMVGRVDYFPGQNGTQPLIVVDRNYLGRLDPSAQPEVWAHGTEASVLSQLERVGATTPIVVTSANVLDLTSFASIGWTFAYLQALSVIMGAGVVFGIVLFLNARSRSRALAYALARRMGLSRRQAWMTTGIEVGALLMAGLGLGIVLGWFLAGTIDRHLNPLPDLPPATLMSVPWSLFGLGLALTAILWIAITSWAQSMADRAKAAELMRSDA
jgi:putative ABC transport system permease protein